MMIKRYGTAIASGSLVTLGLLWLMTTLVSLHHGKPIPPRERGLLDFYTMTREVPVETNHEQSFDELKKPVDIQPQRPHNDAGYDGAGFRRVVARVPTPEFATPTLSTQHDGPLVTMVRVQPVYPARAIAMELEGWVIVQFDVNSDGTVSNPTVVGSSHPVFEKAAVSAALKFRFKARVVDGVALATAGVQNLFRFEMERT